VRIIAGAFRGRSIKTMTGPGYRPSMGKVRESVFSMLEAQGIDWTQTRVADIFAGSGALGIEALSRGALSVVFFEKAPQAVTILRENIQSLGVSSSYWSLLKGNALRLLHDAPDFSWDLVFIDPPYGEDLFLPALKLLVEKEQLAPKGLICVEVEANFILPKVVSSQLTLLRDRIYGQTRIYLWQKNSSE